MDHPYTRIDSPNAGMVREFLPALASSSTVAFLHFRNGLLLISKPHSGPRRGDNNNSRLLSSFVSAEESSFAVVLPVCRGALASIYKYHPDGFQFSAPKPPPCVQAMFYRLIRLYLCMVMPLAFSYVHFPSGR